MKLENGLSTREAYGQALLALGGRNLDVVALDADLSMSSMTASFAERYRESCFAMGFAELRVRHHEELARIEVPTDRIDDVVARRDEVVAAVQDAGYRWVTLDLGGLRSGNLNPS